MFTDKLVQLAEEYSNCQRCPALCESRTKVVFGIGNPDADIMVIAEAPGAEEDKVGVPLIGPSGKILDWFLCQVMPDPVLNKYAESFSLKGGFKKSYIWPDQQAAKERLCQSIFYSNSILCRPEANRDPSHQELINCRDRLHKAIYYIDPLLIISVGKIALESLTGKKVGSILKARGNLTEIKLEGQISNITYPVLPVLHPSYLMRQGYDTDASGPWSLTSNDLKKAIDLVQEYKK